MMRNRLLALCVIGIALVILGYTYMYGAQYAPANHAPDVIKIPIEEGRTVPYSSGNWLSGIKYDKDGSMYAHYHKSGTLEDSFVRKYYVGQTFVFDCNVRDDSTFLSFYQYRGTAESEDPQIMLARFDVDTKESISCEFPDILFGDSYDTDRIEFDPDFPYLSEKDAKARHKYDMYVSPIQNAVALSGPIIEMPPAVPLEETKVDVLSPWNNMVPADRHPGWINDLRYDSKSGRITVVFDNPYLPWNAFGIEYQQNQTFVYGCYDHTTPTLLYLYQYRGTQVINGTLRLILAGIEAYTESTPCTSALIMASTDAYEPGRFNAQDMESRDHPPLPDRKEILAYQKYIAPLPDEPPTLRVDSILTSMLGSVSYQNTMVADLKYHPENDTITIKYDSNRLDRAHSQNYTPGQTYVFDCRDFGPSTEITFRRYLGTVAGGGDRYLAYADFTVSTKFPLSCSDPGFIINVVNVYGRHWPDAHTDWTSEIKKLQRADYTAIAKADLVLEPRALEPPVDPPEGAYDGYYNTFGYTRAEHNPEDDSVTLTYENLYVGGLAVWGNCGNPATGLTHTQTYHVNQTFAYCCQNLGDHTGVDLYQYRGTNLFQGERSFVFVHFEVEVPEQLQCRFPDYLRHTVDLYDADNFDDLYDLHIYDSPEAAYNYTTMEHIRYPVITTPIRVATWPASVPYGEPTLLQYAKEAAFNSDGSLSITYQDWESEAQEGIPGTDYARTYAPGQTFLVYCYSDEDTTYLQFYSYRGTEMIRGEERIVLYYFGAHTRTPAPCPYPDYLDYVDVFDASRFDRQYDLEWYKEF